MSTELHLVVNLTSHKLENTFNFFFLCGLPKYDQMELPVCGTT